MHCSNRKAQIALEFLVMFGVILMMFVVVILLYSSNLETGNEIGNDLAATRLCLEVSSVFSSTLSLGPDSTYELRLPPRLNYRSYSAWVESEKHLVIINYDTASGLEHGATCMLHSARIINSNGSTFFMLAENTSIVNNGGTLHVDP